MYLNKLGFTVTFNNHGEVHLSDGCRNTYMIGNNSNGLFLSNKNIFKLDGGPNNLSLSVIYHKHALSTSIGDKFDYNSLIHQRFAHINDKYIDSAINKQLVKGINLTTNKSFRSPFCESCILAKATRISSTRTPGSKHQNSSLKLISSTTLNKNKKVQFIDTPTIIPTPQRTLTSSLHSTPAIKTPPLTKFAVDLKGPINSGDKSLSAKKYCILFTCMSTRQRFVGFLRNKDEAAKYTENLIKYLRSIYKTVISVEQVSNVADDNTIFTDNMLHIFRQNHIEPIIKPFSELKSDCGGEFVNVDMSEMLGEFDVFHSTTSPYTPHQNGIAERSNRTVFDLAAACMHACGLAIKYWTHAVKFVIHTINHMPNQALLLSSTPYIEIFSTVPDVSYFRIFGCDAYMVIPDSKRPSFGLRAVKGIFIGYNQPKSLSYKILYKSIIYDTGHVYFNENLCSLPTADEELINDIKIFFKNINNNSYDLTDEDIASFAEGHDSNSIKPADDPSNRKIGDIDIIDGSTPVSSRTRNRQAVGLSINVLLKNKTIKNRVIKNNKSQNKYFDLSDNLAVNALLSNTYFYNSTCDVESLYPQEYQYISDNLPQTYAFLSLDSISVEDAINSNEWPQWEQAMKDEINKLSAIDTWEIVHQLPPNRKPLLYKWVLKKKYDIYNKLIYKARLTVKGCAQRAGIDFMDTYSPVAKLTAVRLILSLGTIQNFQFKQFDVQNAFPNATLSDVEIYMVVPKEMNADNSSFLKLKRALYGLKQASREWNLLITNILKELGFRQLTSESCIFVYKNNSMFILLALYVDDMIIGSNTNISTEWLFQQLSKHFVVKQNYLTRCLGVDIHQNKKFQTLTLSRNDYAIAMIQQFNHFITDISYTKTVLPENVHLSSSDCPQTEEEETVMAGFPYRTILGKLNYYTCTLRCDINFAVNYLARFMVNPGIKHWHALLHLLGYIRDHPIASITYRDPSNMTYLINNRVEVMQPNRLYCFVDADFASSDSDDRRSVTGYIIFFNGGIISWKSALQRRTSSSTTEAEYRALHDACKECIWLTRILSEIGYEHTSPVIVFEDNSSTIAATKNPVAHSKLKHIETVYHQIRDFIKDKQIEVIHIQTQFQLADLLTKLQPAVRHNYLMQNILHVE
jgi:hypothetical protein